MSGVISQSDTGGQALSEALAPVRVTGGVHARFLSDGTRTAVASVVERGGYRLVYRDTANAFDAERMSVVIGPTLIRSNSQAPKLLEHGGETRLAPKRGTKPASYPPRPFMGPAFAAEQPKLPGMWKDSVR